MTRSLACLAAVALGVLCLAACQAGPRATLSATSSTTSPTIQASASSAGSQAADRTPATSLPGLPAGFPVPPGAEEWPPDDDGVIARWELPNGAGDVYGFYLDMLPAAGFVVVGAFPGGEAAIVRFTTPEGEALQLDLVGFRPVRIELRLVHD